MASTVPVAPVETLGTKACWAVADAAISVVLCWAFAEAAAAEPPSQLVAAGIAVDIAAQPADWPTSLEWQFETPLVEVLRLLHLLRILTLWLRLRSSLCSSFDESSISCVLPLDLPFASLSLWSPDTAMRPPGIHLLVVVLGFEGV